MNDKPKPLKLALLCAPRHLEVSFSRFSGETGSIALAVQRHLREMLEGLRSADGGDAKATTLAGALGRMAGVSGVDLDELRAAVIVLGKLLDPRDDDGEKTLRRKAEAFVDDYLLVSANDARRLIDDIVAYALEQIQLAKEIRQQKAEE